MIPHPADRAPMALIGEWTDYLNAALEWFAVQPSEFSADDLRQAVPPARPSWPGVAFKTAANRGLIALSGSIVRSTHRANAGTLQPRWVATPDHTLETDCD